MVLDRRRGGQARVRLAMRGAGGVGAQRRPVKRIARRGGPGPRLVHEAEDWLRTALLRILRSPAYLAAFDTAEHRDAFFERLVFEEGAEATG